MSNKRKPRRTKRLAIPDERLVYEDDVVQVVERGGRRIVREWVRPEALAFWDPAFASFDEPLLVSSIPVVDVCCGHPKGDDECRPVVARLVYRDVWRADTDGRPHFVTSGYMWLAEQGRYVDAPTARHLRVEIDDLPGSWLPVYPTTGPAPAVIEAFCLDHGVRYGDAQPMLDLARRDESRTSENPADSHPAVFRLRGEA